MELTLGSLFLQSLKRGELLASNPLQSLDLLLNLVVWELGIEMWEFSFILGVKNAKNGHQSSSPDRTIYKWEKARLGVSSVLRSQLLTPDRAFCWMKNVRPGNFLDSLPVSPGRAFCVWKTSGRVNSLQSARSLRFARFNLFSLQNSNKLITSSNWWLNKWKPIIDTLFQ